MSNIVTTLLDFILDLLRDPEAAADYQRDPHTALAAAGLDGVTPDDVARVMPMVGDCSPVRDWNGHVDSFSRGQDDDRPHSRGVEAAHRDEDDHHERGHEHEHRHDTSPAVSPVAQVPAAHDTVLQHFSYVQNTVTYTEVDASHSIWADDGASVLFGDDNVVGTGDGVVAGGDIDGDVDNSHVAVTVDDVIIGDDNTNVEGNGNITGDGNAVGNENSGNDIGSMDDGAVFGNGNHVDNSSEVTTTDSGNVNSTVDSTVDASDDDGIDDSFNGNDLSDNSTDNSINDSFDDNDLSDDDGIDDSGNGSFNGNDLSDNSTSVTDSFDDNDLSQNTDASTNDSGNLFDNDGFDADDNTVAVAAAEDGDAGADAGA